MLTKYLQHALGLSTTQPGIEGWGAAVAVAAVAEGAESYEQGQAGKSAARAEEAAAQAQESTANTEYTTAQASAAPYLAAGQYGLNTLMGPNSPLTSQFTAADFQSSPGYEAAVNAGQGAITAQAAKTGSFYSPATAAALAGYTANAENQNYAQSEALWNQNRQTQIAGLENLTNTGLTATGQLDNVLENSTNYTEQAEGNKGSAIAAGDIAQGNEEAGITNAVASGIEGYAGGTGTGTNPGNLGGSIPMAPTGSQLTYDADGNITGSVPISAQGTQYQSPTAALNPNYFSAAQAAQLPIQTTGSLNF